MSDYAGANMLDSSSNLGNALLGFRSVVVVEDMTVWERQIG
jgi:hypothetical protein